MAAALEAPGLVVSTQMVRDEMSGTGMSRYWDKIGDVAAQDAVLSRVIRRAQSTVETECEIYLTQRVVKSRPVDAGLERGTNYDVIEDPYDWFKDSFRGYGTFRLRHRPLVSVQRVSIRYGSTTENLQKVIDYPDSWTVPKDELGILNIVPLVGMTSAQAGALVLLPIMGVGLMRWDTIPSICGIDYTAGFLPKNFDPDGDIDPMVASPDFDPTLLLWAVVMLAAAEGLRSIQRAIGAGGGSIGVDGLSRSLQSGRFGLEIKDFEDQAKAKMTQYASKRQAVKVFVV